MMAMTGHSPLERAPVPGSITSTTTGSVSESVGDSASPDVASPADPHSHPPPPPQQQQHQPPLPNPQPRHLSAPAYKARKVSRACDFCKSRKSRCSGTHPCTQCVARGQSCFFNAKYTRGRPRTPPPSAPVDTSPVSVSHTSGGLFGGAGGGGGAQGSPPVADGQLAQNVAMMYHQQPPSQASPPQLSVSSSLSKPGNDWTGLGVAGAGTTAESHRPTTSSTFAGDRPLPELDFVKLGEMRLGDREENRMLLALYFDVCIATYRVLHRPCTEQWLDTLERNIEAKRPIWTDLGHGRAAIVLIVLAIATLHNEKSKGSPPSTGDGEALALRRSDELYGASSWLSRADTAECPTLETAQAGILQVLYLLQTSRFNKAWCVFGNTIPVIWMMGLHRRESSKRAQVSKPDYIQQQCRQRTFWTAYTLDNYLRIVFGRPRHFQDEDIDQVFPDRINDVDMTATLPGSYSSSLESDVDGLIYHAKIAQIIGSISRQVYTIQKTSDEDRAVAAYRLTLRIREWRDSLPAHLGSVSPSLLIPRYRRQAIILKLAYNHAIMHACRPFLHSNSSESTSASVHVQDCLGAAHGALEIANAMACEGPMFNAFWWTHYVVYCALVVVYMYEIQQRRQGRPTSETRSDLELAERCRVHLSRATATNSPSRRYGVILEELRALATSERLPHQSQDYDKQTHMGLGHLAGPEGEDATMDEGTGISTNFVEAAGQSVWTDPRLWDQWETADWLELDSSAFRYPANADEFILWP